MVVFSLFGMHLPEFTAVGMLGFAMRSGVSRATPKDAEHRTGQITEPWSFASTRSAQRGRLGVETRVQSPGYTASQNPSREARHPQWRVSSDLGPNNTSNSRRAERLRLRQRKSLMTPNGDRAIGPGLISRGHPTRKPAFEIKFALAPRDSLPAATAAGLVTEAASNHDTGLG